MSAVTDSLRIGDYVLLRDVVKSSILGCEGILLEEVSVVEGTQTFQDCLFAVHLQRQYSASRDLQAFLKIYNHDIKNIKEPAAKKYLLALQRGLENERKLNDTYMRKKFGQKVVFGDIVQLYHVKSGKYLTIIPDQLAKDERENTRISLDTNGNAFSWLQIAPRFKIDKDGDNVLTNAEVYFRVYERSNEYLHTADRNPLPGRLREVNCAFESTSWKLTIYQSSLDAQDRTFLLASQLVYISDPETRSALAVMQKKLESLDSDVNAVKKLTSSPHEEEEDSEGGAQEGSLILEPLSTDSINSNFLWYMYKQPITCGGPFNWKGECVKFRHMNTGLYMSLVTKVENAEGIPHEEFIVATTSNPDGEDTHFTVSEINSSSKLLSNGKAVQMGVGGVWLERGDVLEDSIFTYSLHGTREKFNAVSLLINRCEESSKRHRGGTSSGSGEHGSENSSEPLDVFAGIAARRHLVNYLEMIVVPKSDNANTVLPSATRGDLDFFQVVADKVVFFSQGFPISATNVQLGIDKGESSLIKVRQDLFREQGLLEQVLKIINKLIPMTERLERIKSPPNKKKKVRVSDEEMAAINMAQFILGRAFSIIYYAILNSEANQMYVADFMPVLLAHLNAQPLAGKCVTEMLSKNMELQETKIGTREIQIFVDKLRSSKMNAMYLQLLQACCSCEGNGVDGNQCKVANLLFSNTNDIIIHLHSDEARCSPCEWKTGLYIPEEMIPGSPVRGDILMKKGLPQLSLSWTTNSIDFSPLGLFGRLSVGVEELFRIKHFDFSEKRMNSTENKKARQKRKAMEEQKNAVANYFIAEMFLGAEMCMDRNYVAMHKLDDLFPFEVLVTILRIDVSHALKGAAARLLMCLHIDRDPQASSKIPCLTRTWSSIKQNDEPQLPYVEPARRYVFGLVQQIISEFIRDMSGNEWDELSKHMLYLLRTLVKFNFYGTTERMEDIIVPLVQLLDRRSANVDPDHSSAAALSGSITAKPSADEESLAAASQQITIASLNKKLEDDVKDEDKLQVTDHMDYSAENPDEEKQPSVVGRLLRFVINLGVEFYNLNYKAAKVIASIEENKPPKAEAYVTPLRYSKAPIFELETMVEAVDILAFSQRVIEDRDISILLRYFFAWESGLDKRSPPELFEEAIKDSRSLTLASSKVPFDDIMIDILMYVHTPLVQSALEVLMAHHSKRRILLDNVCSIQLLASHRRERQYIMVDQMLKQLEQNAETHELWGELETESDHAVNKQTKDIMRELTDICRIRRQ
eukprot:scaffold1159_cov160-Ochromonas_danica.AAC.22